MAKIRVFTAFDFDYDEDLRNLLVGQSKNPESPFEMADWSVKQEMKGDWQSQVRARIRQVDQVVIMCGENTHRATGVSIELKIAQEEGKPYFLLYGRSSKTCYKPMAAKNDDKMYEWSWDNLQKLLRGAR